MPANQRRSFLTSLVAEPLSAFDEFRGIPQYRCADLATLPDAALHPMVPVFHRSRRHTIENGWLLVQKTDGSLQPYRELQGHEAYILSCFDGQHSIDGICNCLEAEFQCSREMAFSVVRDLFLQLALAGVCHPAGGHE